MAKITRIKATDAPLKRDVSAKPHVTHETAKNPEPAAKKAKKNKAAAAKAAKTSKSGKKPFILFRPFIALGHYLRDSWAELRQVRWPNRKTTWKMVLAVLVYAALLMAFILLLDLFFTWLFNLILG